MHVPQIMPQAHFLAPTAPAAGREGLRIALINNLPDAALRATERQFCRLLDRASEGLTIKLDLYTLPGIVRGRDAQAHLAACYEDMADLERTRPDGIIVTGTEPQQNRLQDEAFWPAFTRLFDFTRQTATPVIWCCLAAHAAVLHGDGIERTRLREKLSGVFESRVMPGAHDLLRGVPSRWSMPHSRLHGLSERVLIERGYEIVSRSQATGADVFLRRGDGCHVFMQGHPEYAASSLVAEFRRDVRRFLLGERDSFPAPPERLFPPTVLRRLSNFRGSALRHRDINQLGVVDDILAGSAPEAVWSRAACKLYSNWITLVSELAYEAPAVTGWHSPLPGLALARRLVDVQAAE